jgi:hypothetical protein
MYFLPALVGSALYGGHERSLVPALIVSMNVSETPLWMQTMSERCELFVIPHQLSFAAELNAVGRRSNGAYLRLDIPLVLEILKKTRCAEVRTDIQYEYALYTDTDAMFLDNFSLSSLKQPKVMYIGPEHIKGTMRNSGVSQQ